MLSQNAAIQLTGNSCRGRLRRSGKGGIHFATPAYPNSQGEPVISANRSYAAMRHTAAGFEAGFESPSVYDHCDLPTLGRLAKRFDPLVVTPLGNAPLVQSA